MELSEEHIKAALDEIDKSGVPLKRRSTRFCLIRESNQRHYPPKYTLALAYQLMHQPYPRKNHKGGEETNRQLWALGYKVEPCKCGNDMLKISN